MAPSLHRKWVHQGGVARLAYSRDGSHLMTAAGESFVRVFSGEPRHNDDDSIRAIDPQTSSEDATVLCMDCSMEYLVVGREDGTVEMYDASSGEYDYTGLLTRSSLGLAIRAVKFSPNGQRVAVASDEISAKIIDVRDVKRIQVLEGHDRGIRSVTWSPDGNYVTTSSSDGKIRVFDVSDATTLEPTCIRVLDGLIAAEEPESEMQCEAVWHPSGKYFVIGTKAHEIAVVSRETWEREGLFEKDGHTGNITTLTFSPNGRYLCSSSRDGEVLLWDSSTRRVILRTSHRVGLVGYLAWRPGAGSNSISLIDNQGNLVRWDDVIASNLPHPNDAPAAGAANAARAAAAEKADTRASILEDDDDDMLDLEIGGDAGERAVRNDDDDDDDMEDFVEDDNDDNLYKSRSNRNADEGDDGLPPPLVGSKSKASSTWVVSGSSKTLGSSLVKGQPPFQPGSTPMKDKRRYLAFNMLGAIHIIERESHNIVNVEFHDRSSHAPSHFDDFAKFKMASLGHQGAVYASASSELGSTLCFKPSESWGQGQGEWTLDLPTGELVTAIALGGGKGSKTSSGEDGDDSEDEDEVTLLSAASNSGVIVAATNKQYLRFFTGSGSQTYLLNFGAEIVALAASKEFVLIAHRPSEYVQPGRQDLSFTLLDFETYEIVQRGKMPLGKNATLSWIGFSDEQMPYMYDSNGLLSALSRSRRPMQARWVPMLDTRAMARREDKHEDYWPVGATDNDFMCIILKGQEKHPQFPVPIVQDFPLQPPMLNLGEPTGENEAKLFHLNVSTSHARDCLPAPSPLSSRSSHKLKGKIANADLEMDKSLIKLIQLALKANRQQRGLDLARMLSSSKALAGARRIGEMYHLNGFNARIDALIAARDGFSGMEFRGMQDKQKREGKYAHLLDDSTIPDSSLDLDAASGAHGRSFGRQEVDTQEPFAKPFKPAHKATKLAKDVFSESATTSSQRRPVYESRILTGSGDEDEETSGAQTYMSAEPSHYGDDGEEQEGPSVRTRLDSVIPLEPTPVQPVKTRMNPFAKRAPVGKANATAYAGAGPGNPFSTGKAKSGGTQLQKTGSFFDRVDASNGNGNTSSGGAKKQATLFGMPGGAASDKKGGSNGNPRGRKRKSDGLAGDDGGNLSEGSGSAGAGATAQRKEARKLDTFFRKGPGPASLSGKGVTDAERSEREGSDALPDLPTRRSASVNGEDDDADVVETQVVADGDSALTEDLLVDATEEEGEDDDRAEARSSGDHSRSSLDEDCEVPEAITPADEVGEGAAGLASPAKSDTASRLERFRHVAA